MTKRFMDFFVNQFHVKEIENCMPCILRYAVPHLKWISPYRSHCEHARGELYSEKPYMGIDRSWDWLFYSTTIFTTFTMLWILYYVITSSTDHSLLLVTHVIYCFYGTIAHICAIWKSEWYLASINMWCKIFEDRKFLGFTDLMSLRYRRRIRLRCLILIYFLCVSCVVFTLMHGFQIYQYGYSLDSVTVLMLLSTTIIQFSIHAIFVAVNSIFFYLLKAIYNDVIDDISFFQSHSAEVLEKRLKQHNRFIFQGGSAIQYYNNHLSAGLTVLFPAVVAVLIINIYLWVTPRDEKYFLDIKFLQLRTVFLILGIFELALSLDKNNLNEDVLSFLFKYPISKLTRQEAAQVEMLVATLILQKPVVRASDTITIGRRLLASISGTVLTYVLVALQFRAAWSET
ncbi:uncharacterized protein isoform X1 [Leptinotarsa decemlineata]|uniref:uncharacterized protein isoform X1 n=1 Tax=Leptinotarsa decemlineata TaxID=7539 RepID=UPI003D30BADD